MKVCADHSCFSEASSRVFVVSYTVGINSLVEALSHVIWLKEIGIGYQDHLKSIGKNVSMLKLYYIALFAEVLENAFNDSGIEKKLEDGLFPLGRKQQG